KRRSTPAHRGSAVFSSITGVPDTSLADVSGKGQDVVGMLLAVGGRSTKTKSGIDLGAAAKRLGVTPRTVQRWLAGAGIAGGPGPSAANTKKLVTASRQASSTKRGRAAALARSAARQRLAGGAKLKFDGKQGPHSLEPPYGRDRITELTLDPDHVEAMLNAWEDGGEAGFMSWAADFWDENYKDDWKFGGDGEIDVQITPLGPGGH